ncbi:MAG: xanthine dehydrogenase family protein molybdopterin-binding subunit [Fimbriimonadaceae bacterium]|nr:xanthine dehydrogenase family protein molybdopterin-binding subunit [Fimbriimonadaceae bacterium]
MTEDLLHEACDALYLPSLRRRGFLQAAGGLAVLCAVGPALGQADDPRRAEVGTWLRIDHDGSITVYSGKIECGQNIRTTLAQIVAEELAVDPTSLTLVLGDTDLVPWDAGTFGSQTTPRMMPILRDAAAAARAALLDLAAARWQVPATGLRLAAGQVREVGGPRQIGLGELVAGHQLLRRVGQAPATAPSDWRVAGQPQRKANGRDIVTGQQRYPSDIVRPGLLYGAVLRPPGWGAELTAVDLAPAQALPGVTAVRQGNFVGVAAPDSAAAAAALAALRPHWRPAAAAREAELWATLRPAPAATLQRNNVAAGLAQAAVTAASSYRVAYIAHVPLEPRAAVAEWSDGKLTVWTGTQRPFGVQQELQQAFGLTTAQVRVIQPDVGSGYGGKHTGEAALEAARLAQAAGRPVKVCWTREEEFQWAYARPAGVIDVLSGAAADGRLVAFEQHNHNSGPAGLKPPYAIEAQHTEFHRADSPLRQGSYRGLAGCANFFARESHLDELAHALRLDPLALRLRNTTDGRLRGVLEAAAERFGWAQTPPAGHGYGIACGYEKLSWVATCAEVTVRDGRIVVERLVTAFDCGAVINPDTVRNQIQGMHVQALGGALFEALHFADQQITNRWLSQYRVPRLRDIVPEEIVLLDRRDQPSVGAGETPLMAVAPAIANALFRATGQRLRDLPLRLPQ